MGCGASLRPANKSTDAYGETHSDDDGQQQCLVIPQKVFRKTAKKDDPFAEGWDEDDFAESLKSMPGLLLWHCQTCGEDNARRRAACNNCKTPSPLRTQTLDALASRGLTFRQMLEFYCKHIKTKYGNPEATTGQIVHDYVLKLTGHKKQSLSEFLGDQLSGYHCVPSVPDVHIVHSWEMKHKDVLQALVFHFSNGATRQIDDIDAVEQIFKDKGLQSKLNLTCFFCAYTLNQHNVFPNMEYEIGHPRCEVDAFEHVAAKIHRGGGYMLLVTDQWHTSLRRVWCLDEIHQSITTNMRLEWAFTVLKEPGDVDVSKAGASKEEDKQRIFTKIQNGIGFREFNINVNKAVKHKYQGLLEMARREPPDIT